MKSENYMWIMILTLFCLPLAGLTMADSVVKTLYIDGNYVTDVTANDSLSFPYNHLIIGAEGNVGYRYNGYKGKIDEFAIYEGILSDTRISAHYNALASNYVTEVTSDAPLLYLRFEDAGSADGQPAANSGSAAVNGTYIDSVTLSAGALGKAAEFHGTGAGGSGDCVDVDDSSEELALVDVTIELWMNSTADPNDYPRLFQHNGVWNVTDGYGAMFQPNQMGLIGGGTTDYVDAIINDGNWHHIVVTYDSTVLPPDPYFDAVMVDDPLAFYRFEDASSGDGDICADSAERAYKDGEYINLNPGTSGIADIALVPSLDGLGQAAQLHGDDGAGNGTCISIYDGWSSEYPTTIAHNADGTARQTLSVEFWMKSSTPENYPRILQHNDGSEEGFGVGSSDGELTMMGGGDTWYTGTGSVFDGQWHHVAVTYQPGEGEPNDIYEYIYIDGEGIGGNVVSTGAHLSVPTDFLTLGNNGTKYYVYNAFEGLIDEVAFYDTVLSAESVWLHYSAATGAANPYDEEVLADDPVLYLQFESQNPDDSSVNDYYVEYGASAMVQESMGISNAIYLGSDGAGYAAAWNQTEPYTGENGEIGDQYAFTSGDISFEMWFKLDAIEDYGMFFQQIGPYTREQFAPGIGNSAGTFRILNGNGGFWYTNVTMPTDGDWHHIVVTYDEALPTDDPNYAMGIQFYLDSELRGETTVGSAANPAKLGPELNHILIGGENDRGAVYNLMTGLTDEFAIYDGILSADRVAAHYAAGVADLKPVNCAEVWLRGEGLATDINMDCHVDFTDFAIIAADWFLCNDPVQIGLGNPDCAANW